VSSTLQPQYSFCESVTGIGPWHLRALTTEGLKLGGGIDTPSLCDLVRPLGDNRDNRRGGGGWDLRVTITPHHLEDACPRCVAVYKQATAC